MSKKVFVGGLPWEAEASDLEVHFSVFGPVESTNVIKDRETGKSRGFGFVTFVDEGGAQAACQAGSIEIEAGGRCRTVKIDMASEKPRNNSSQRRPSPVTSVSAAPPKPSFEPIAEDRPRKTKKKGRENRERFKDDEYVNTRPKQRRGRKKQSWKDFDWD